MPSRTDGKIIPVAAICRWQPDGSCKAEAMFSETDVFPMRDLLLKLEWEGCDFGATMCPICKGRNVSHEQGCALAALLDRLR